MKPTINIITLAVKDMAAALEFYTQGLGIEGEVSQNEYHAAIDIGNDLSLALFTQEEFNKFAGQSGEHDKLSRTVISHTAKTREEVDEILSKANAAGGTLPAPTTDYEWGYSGYFKDLDGHLWEVVYFRED